MNPLIHSAAAPHLEYFSQPDILQAVGALRLARFFQDFSSDLKAATIVLPDPESDTATYLNSVADLFAHAERLPQRMWRPLLAVERLAAPENSDLLNSAIVRYLSHISFSHNAPPLDRALELWFGRPETLFELAASCQPIPQTPPAASPSRSQDASPNGENKSEQNHDASGAPERVPPFRCFSDPDFLMRLGSDRLERLFARFKAELAAKNITMPSRACEHSAYLQAFAGLLSRPENLPAPLTAVIRAVEEFAAPDGTEMLRKCAEAAGVSQPADSQFESLALDLWFRVPFDLAFVTTLKTLNRLSGPAPEPPAPSPNNQPAAAAPAPDANGHSSPLEFSRFPRNKIARLPRDVRDSINRMLAQAIPYAQILAELGDVGKSLNKSNLWRWKKGPYQRWLLNQQRLEDTRAQLQFTLEAVRQNQNSQIHEATQQIAALRISELFTQIDLPALKQALQDDPNTAVRLANLLPKLSQGGLDCERQRIELAERKLALSEQDPSKRVIPSEDLKRLVHQLRLM